MPEAQPLIDSERDVTPAMPDASDNDASDLAASARSTLPHIVENCQAFPVRGVVLLVNLWIAA